MSENDIEGKRVHWEDVIASLEQFKDIGIRQILTLRGDQIANAAKTEGQAFANSVEFISAVKEMGFDMIRTTAYPDIHKDAKDADADFDWLLAKFDAGACEAITQFFFDNAIFLRFRDRVAAANINVELIPGILPVTNFNTLVRFADACGASIPATLKTLFEGLDEDPSTRQLIAAHAAVSQAEDLGREGVNDFHFYTLNRADLSFAVCHALGVRGNA